MVGPSGEIRPRKQEDTTMKAIHIVILSALVTGAAIKAAPALAQGVSVSVVRTADLDLSSTRDRQALEQRLSAAAREVCGTASDADLEGKNEVRRCRADVLARANVQRDELLASANGTTPITLVASAR
jgi:UrcA family protein